MIKWTAVGKMRCNRKIPAEKPILLGGYSFLIMDCNEFLDLWFLSKRYVYGKLPLHFYDVFCGFFL